MFNKNWKDALIVYKGEKWFYLIRPSMENLEHHERWLKSSDKNDVFFPDLVDCCYK